MQTSATADVTLVLESATERSFLKSALDAYWTTANTAQQALITQIVTTIDSVEGAS